MTTDQELIIEAMNLCEECKNLWNVREATLNALLDEYEQHKHFESEKKFPGYDTFHQEVIEFKKHINNQFSQSRLAPGSLHALLESVFQKALAFLQLYHDPSLYKDGRRKQEVVDEMMKLKKQLKKKLA